MKSSDEKPSKMKVAKGFDSAPNHFFIDSATSINVNPFIGKILFSENNSKGEKVPVVSLVMPLSEMLNLASKILSIASNIELQDQLDSEYKKITQAMRQLHEESEDAN